MVPHDDIVLAIRFLFFYASYETFLACLFLSCVGLYKVEFRILEIRISGETNLKKHFLSGNWIRKKILKGCQTAKSGAYYTILSNLIV